MFYASAGEDTGMRWCIALIIAAVLLIFLVPVAGATAISINASPDVVHIGDTVTLRGNISGINTIAVYLFVVGHDLDPRGVTLDNLNIPTGRGLFTTAPVNMKTGDWEYKWDTSVILGELKPGNYTVYVVSAPMDRMRFVREEHATADIWFLPSDKPVTEIPISPIIPVAALVIAGIVGCSLMHQKPR
jgi:hypothetical protein